MGGDVWNVVLGVVSSAVSAVLAWSLQAGLRRRRLNRRRAFFGMPAGSEALVVVPRKAGTGKEDRVVAQRDVYALMELATLIRECGATATVLPHDEVRQGLGDKTEFCIGGVYANDRSAAHLRWKFPGVGVTAEWEQWGANKLIIGGREFVRDKTKEDYALLLRIAAGEGGRPTFLVHGQTATANLATVRYLTRHIGELIRRYPGDQTFALLLRVVQPFAYGPDVVELVGDVTAQALEAPAAGQPAPLPPVREQRSAAPSPSPAAGEPAASASPSAPQS
ncbi:hypothetical protein [Streptacidiphilus monticola]|jgi:hypothetical protein|uniref:Uncharacterized protein n=1 Tax=Streptacidiphilus monticola TaxID=2161674 RepID=A0ABW1G5Y7_9ACTN